MRGPLIAAILLLAPLLAAPTLLNAALVPLHKTQYVPEQQLEAARFAISLAKSAAWGPFAARAWASEALAARREEDNMAEASALDRAIQLGAWDASLTELLAEQTLISNATTLVPGDRGSRALVDVLIRRARALPPEDGLLLARRSEPLAPRDPLPYFAIAEQQARLGRTDGAAAWLASSVMLRGPEAWRRALAARLVDRSAPLPALELVNDNYSRDDITIFHLAIELFLERGDRAGARFSEELIRRFAVRPR